MFKNHKRLIVLAAVLITTAVLLLPQIAQAGLINDALINISSWIANQIIYVVGQLLLIAINILIKVASFNDFINANIVNIGWVIIRDLANMAIVIALMIIAFYTVLNKESYEYKKMLPKLILAAILVNFSKLIAGIMIDLGQVIMMTFVHAFEGIAAGNLTYGFGLQDMMSVRNAAEGAGMGAEISDWTVFGALVLGVIMVTVALGVVVTMAVMLLVRVVVLWLLIIFSPVAYVAGLIPGGEKHAQKWWGEFGKYITFGPVLAFLFWLSMTVLSQVTTQNRLMSLEMQSQQYLAGGSGAASTVDYAYFASQVSSPQRVFDYMVTVVLLIMCMIFAKQAGVMGSQFASNTFNKMQGAGKWIARRPGVWGKKAGGAAVGAAWRRSTIPQTAEAMYQRLGRTRAGRAVGLTKEAREEAEILRRGKVAARKTFGGGMPAARRAAEDAVATQRAENLEKQGYMDTESIFAERTKDLIARGKGLEAKGMIYKGAEQGWIKRSLLTEYRDKFGTTDKKDAEKFKESAIFEEKVQTKQKVKGGTFNQHLSDFKYDSDVKDHGFLKPEDKAKNVKKQIKDFTRGELSSAITAKNFGAIFDAETKEAINPLLGAALEGLYERGDAIGTDIREPSKRNIVAEAVKRVSSDPTKFNLKKEDAKGMLSELHRRLTAETYVDGKAQGGQELDETILAQAQERINEDLYKIERKISRSDIEKGGTEINLKGLEITPEVKGNINNPKVKSVITPTISGLQTAAKTPGFLSDPMQYKILRKGFAGLASQLGGLSKTLNTNFGNLGKQVKNLDAILPTEDATELEVKAVTQEYGIAEDDIKELVNKFT